jgi:hypothetical protein
MRRLGAVKMAALLGLTLAVSVAPLEAQTYKPEPMMQGKPWDILFGSSTPTPEVKEPVHAPSSTPTVADRALQHDRLMRAYLRRVKVCDRLREIAYEMNDNALETEAQRLDDLAFTLYLTQSKQLLGTGAVPGAEELEAGKPVRNSAAALSTGTTRNGTLGWKRDGKDAPDQGQQTSAMREGER